MEIIDELPFDFVDGQGFKLFSRTMEPIFDISSCVTVMRDCLKYYIEENERLMTTLGGQ